MTRGILDYVDENGRNRSAVNEPVNQFDGGHWCKIMDVFIGDGKNRRRKRHNCAWCPASDEYGSRVNRQCTTFCPACDVPLHQQYFAAYHVQNGFNMINNLGAHLHKSPRAGRPSN